MNVRSSRFAALFALALAAGCGNAEDPMATPPPPQTGDCDPNQTACTYYHDFGQSTLMAGEEVIDQCYTFKLNNPVDVLVNTVQLDNDGGFHHSNWFFVPETSYDTDVSIQRCHDIGFSEIGAALTGGVLFAQSTQSRSEVQQFPAGAFVRVPAYARIITDAHLLNASASALQSGLRLTIKTIPPAQQKVELLPFRLSYTDLHIPAMEHSQFTGECDLKTQSEVLLGAPFFLKLYYVLPHFHNFGEMFQLQLLGGAESGRVLYDLKGGIGEPHGQTYDPPIDISQATGLRFTCGYNNSTGNELQWGNGDGEMCVMLGFAEAHARYDATVGKDKTVVDQGGVSMHSGPCGIAVYPTEQ